MRLHTDYYQQPDVVALAQDLVGKVLVTHFDGLKTSVRITETEAYRAPDDRACHAYNNRRTARTETMFAPGGCAYIYLCYGIHHLFNIVTGPNDAAQAVLIRAGQPLEGLPVMLERRRQTRLKPTLTVGPGAIAQALGLHTRYNGLRLDQPDSHIWIEHDGYQPAQVASGKRIGVDYAGDCAAWPWRFWDEAAAGWHKRPL
jgi:DNA-3-methyladenine glycosylase